MSDNLFGVILTVSFSGAYLPQIVKMFKRKSSNDVSFLMLVINAIGYSCGLGYVLVKNLNVFWLLLNYTSGLMMTILCIVFWAFYRGADRNEVRKERKG